VRCGCGSLAFIFSIYLKPVQYDLRPVPLALFNLDGSMRKTTKSATLTWIEGKTAVKQLDQEENPELLVIDLMMLLRMICTEQSDCKTFGNVSGKVAAVVRGLSFDYTALVGDNYQNEESIKSEERARRAHVQMQEIRNPTSETPLPRQTAKFLSNPLNKINLADFVLRDLIDTFINDLPDEMTVFLCGGFRDPEKAVRVRQNTCEDVESLQSDHEEADSRMFMNIDYAVRELQVTSVVLWSLDSDVAAICPRVSLQLGIKIFFKTGTRQQKRFIPMHDVALELGEKLSNSLPVIHALSGCDSTSAFYGMGKKRWSSVLTKHLPLLEGLSEIGEDPINISRRAEVAVTQTVSCLYNDTLSENIDDIRYELFSKKGSSSERLPPTSDALKEHTKRANYQSYIWKSATKQNLNLPSPVEAGWTTDENSSIVPKKMTQQPAPEAVIDFTRCSCKTDCSTGRCKCRKENLPCTDACACEEEICENRFAYDQPDSEENEQ